MRKLLVFIFLLSALQSSAQDPLKLSEAFLKSVQEKNFAVLKPWLGPNAKTLKEKWQQVIDNANQAGLDLKSITIKRMEPGETIPGLPMRSIIAVYEYDGKEWDDLLLMVTNDKNIKLVEIPLSSYMFALHESRRGKNIKDAKKAGSGN